MLWTGNDMYWNISEELTSDMKHTQEKLPRHCYFNTLSTMLTLVQYSVHKPSGVLYINNIASTQIMNATLLHIQKNTRLLTLTSPQQELPTILLWTFF